MRIFIPLYEEGEEEHDPSGEGAAHVGILPPHLQGEDHGQGLGREVQDGPDDEVEEETASEVLPGEGEAVHDEGRGEPVEVHDEQLQPESGMSHDVQEASLGCGLFRWTEDNFLRLHGVSVPLTGGGHDLTGLSHPALGDQPAGRLGQPVQDDRPHGNQGGNTWRVRGSTRRFSS